jgi:hypothetical protein
VTFDSEAVPGRASAGREAGRRLDAAVATAIFLGCATLYVATLTPSLPFPIGDSHELTTAAARLGIAHPTGYPLYTWLGFAFIRLLPFGDIAYRVNCMSALLGAAGVAGIYVLGRQLDLRPLPAAVAAALFGLAPTFWSQAVIPEVYAPNLLVLTVVLNLLLAWSRRGGTGWLVGAAFALGLSPGLHMSDLGFGAACALFAVLTDPGVLRRPRVLLLVTAAFLVGLAQFAWLPLRAHTVHYPMAPPNTLSAFLDYTVRAFAPARFAFPLSELPNRATIYASLLRRNFGVAGAALGLAGMWVALARDPRRFWLLMGAYLVNVAMFTQLAVFDVDVFFLEGWLVWVLFVGFAVDAVARGPRSTAATAVAASALLALMGTTSFAANDRRSDTVIGDFYRATFAMLPPGSVLIGPSGAFGQTIEYFHHFLGLRPDVTIVIDPTAPEPPPDVPRFTTLAVQDGRLTSVSAWVSSRRSLTKAWYVPVLLSAERDLLLWQVRTTPPALAPLGPPAVQSGRRLGGETLEGFTMAPVVGDGPSRVHLETQWRLEATGPVVVSTRVGGVTIESHVLGFGNRERYAAEVGPPGDRLAETFDVLAPSSLPAGRQPVEVGVTRLDADRIATEWETLGDVQLR